MNGSWSSISRAESTSMRLLIIYEVVCVHQMEKDHFRHPSTWSLGSVNDMTYVYLPYMTWRAYRAVEIGNVEVVVEVDDSSSVQLLGPWDVLHVDGASTEQQTHCDFLADNLRDGFADNLRGDVLVLGGLLGQSQCSHVDGIGVAVGEWPGNVTDIVALLDMEGVGCAQHKSQEDDCFHDGIIDYRMRNRT